jgi:NIMA (never in mitosis gene a)-related kinase
LVKRIEDGKEYCMKQVEMINLTEEEQVCAVNEAKFLSKVSSPYVIKYYESFIEKGYLCIVMEYADKGTLDELMKKQKSLKVAFPENEIWRYCIEILLGTLHIHDQKLIHRDLKTSNVFLGGKYSFEILLLFFF